ncbi:hypothetical protein M7I_1786 [Glarea lozoyensis 74030]|nr:hypothetical protein M7I_1786 [Glarea lozoyensis 74030]
MFIMIVKVVMFSLHIWFPFLSVIINAVLTGLYAASLYGQAGPDNTDPKHPSSSAWYITQSCDFASKVGARGYCLQAKGAFAVTVIMTALFLANMILSIWCLIPTSAQRAADGIDIDDMQMKGGNNSDNNSDSKFEMNVRTNAVPFTPRTLAFNTLDRQLPLRSQQIEAEKKKGGKAPRFA